MPAIKINGKTYAGSPVADSLPFDDTNIQLGVDNTQDAIEGVYEKINSESTDIHADLDLLFGRDNTVTYDDIPSMVLGVHNSLSNYQSVCKNYLYSTNSALVIGNRYSSGRGRYLVLPRTNVVIYVYQVKDDSAYNERTIATVEDLASYALNSDLVALNNATKSAQYGSCDNVDLNTLNGTGIYFCSSNGKALTSNNFPVARKGYLVVYSATEGAIHQIYYSNKSYMYMRTYWDSSWGAWYTIPTTGDLANYTQSTTVKNIQVVSSLPSDAASHTDTLYIITE